MKSVIKEVIKEQVDPITAGLLTAIGILFVVIVIIQVVLALT